MSNDVRTRLSLMRNKEGGFSLIEILVTVAILSIIAGIAVGFFMNQRTKARDAALMSDIEQTVTATERYINSKEGRRYVSPPRTGSPYNPTAHYPPLNSGWTVVINPPGAPGFVGARNAPTFTPPGFPQVNLSEGAALGIVASPLAGRVVGQYCIAANMEHSSFDRSKNSWTSTYYYDSALGRGFPGEELPPGGACNPYHFRINS